MSADDAPDAIGLHRVLGSRILDVLDRHAAARDKVLVLLTGHDDEAALAHRAAALDDCHDTAIELAGLLLDQRDRALDRARARVDARRELPVPTPQHKDGGPDLPRLLCLYAAAARDTLEADATNAAAHQEALERRRAHGDEIAGLLLEGWNEDDSGSTPKIRCGRE